MGIVLGGKPESGKKYAIIINGDTEARHLGNVNNAIKALEAEADYEISVISPKEPDQGADHYAAPTQEGLNSIISGLKEKMGENDQLVVYITSHGGIDKNGNECTVLEKTCIPTAEIAHALSLLHYSQRAVVFPEQH